ncbi:MAG: Primosomal protein N' [Porticoccaceae bacterium UBA1117]|nr:MAG: Primosomal protein N' [Porticoccaceae bacterium UBA1117]
MAEDTPLIVRVAVLSPLRRLFDYLIPNNVVEAWPDCKAEVGCRVMVPFGRREVVGLVVEHITTSELSLDQLKPVNRLLDSGPLLPSKLLTLFSWAANYYQHPIGDALFGMLPVLLRKGEPLPILGTRYWQLTNKGKGLGSDSLKRARSQKELIDRLLSNGACADSILVSDFSRAIITTLESKQLIESFQHANTKISTQNILKQDALTLHDSQRLVLDSIDQHSFNCYLLDGVTGSGKTEIYLQAIEQTLRYDRQALVLIPEISLTPQTEKRFRDRFNVPIVTLHSGLTDKQRLAAWTSAKRGSAQIVLGTRSAIFTPLARPGLIIVDEEHDQSYKQQEGFRYSARDLAVSRAHKESISVILGSATPSIESLNNCATGRYNHLILTDRAGTAKQPNWSLVDLKSEKSEAGIAASTLSAISQTVEQGHQVLVFLNRRGFAPAIICHHCGWSAECHNCDSRLTVHRARNRLICHHCDYQQRVPHLCPGCQGQELISLGEGTERSEEYLEKCFPQTKVLRVDRDSTRKKGAMQEVFEIGSSGEPCILIGTQMLAKGHHFANVTLVAVLDADSGLFSPDFRSHERLGQLLTQVAGRSGRGDLPGRVIIQTHQPQHPLLEMLIGSGYSFFAQQIMAERKITQLPPFRHMAVIRAESDRANEAEKFLRTARNIAEGINHPSPLISYLGPLPAMLEKRAGRYRFVLQIDASKRSILQVLLDALIVELNLHKDARRVRWSIDVDPQEM